MASLLLLAVAIGGIISGVSTYRYYTSSEKAPAEPAERAQIEMPDLMKILVGDMDFSEPKDAVYKKATADEVVAENAEMTAVTGLKRLADSSDSISLGWDAVSGASGYRVYWRDMNKEDSDYRLFATVKTPGLEIRNIGRGAMYGFRVCAYSASEEGEAQEISCATVPDEAENLRVTDRTKTTTTVEWDKNERADGYIMERCYKGKWSEYRTFGADETEFTDTDLTSGKAYYYRLSSFREDSDGRLISDSITVRTVAGLLGPKDNGSESKLGRVSLDFKKSDYADGYEIYYSTDKDDWEFLGDTDSTHFSTSRLVDGETYFFRIYPYREVDEYTILGDYTELEFVAKKEIYGETVGDTYVEVSVSDQHMWYIVDGDVYLESDCVTGNYKSADTPKGFWAVNNKISPCTLKGDDYVSYVTYWMPFIGGGWGLHDATWRSKFGGNIYKGDGSHGCVNLPYDIAKKMYAHIEIGTPVIVY